MRTIPAALSMLLVAAACGRDVPGLNGASGGRVLFVDPAKIDGYVGLQVAINVRLLREDGSFATLIGNPDLTIETTNKKILTVDATGQANAIAVGQATVEVRYQELAATVPVNIVAGAPMSLRIEPAAATIAINEMLRLKTLLKLTTGTELDVTAGSLGTAYTTSSPALASVDADGVVTGLKEGSLVVVAHHAMLDASSNITVTSVPKDFVAVELTPEVMSLSVGEQSRFMLTGVTAAGMRMPIALPNTSVIFMIDNAAIATVGADGTAIGVRSGSANVTVKLDALSDTSKIDVRPGEEQLIGLDATPNPLFVDAGGTAQLRVTGFYSDGSTADLTAGSTGTRYTAGPRMIVLSDNDGLITGVSSGMGTVTVRHGTFRVVVNVTVGGDDPLVALEVRPNPINLIPGEGIQLAVIGTFASGMQQDLTLASSGTTYRAPRNGIIDAQPDGFVWGLIEGSGDLIITNAAVTIRVPVTVSGNTTVVSLRFEPLFFQMNVNDVQFYRVIATFSDGSDVDVTFDPALMIQSANPMVADLAPMGQIVAISEGNTTLRASYQTVTAFATVLVGSSQLVSISITAHSPLTIGTREPYTVTGFFADGSMADLTFDPNITVFADDASIITVQSGGAIFGNGLGTTNLNAQHSSGFFASTSVEVVMSGLMLTAIEIIAPSQIQVNTVASFTVLAHWSDGSTTDITLDPALHLSSTNGMVLGVGSGVLQGLAVGGANVTASFMLQFDSAHVEVVNMMPAVLAIVWSPLQVHVDINNTTQAQVFALLSDGTLVDISFDPTVMYSGNGPFSFNVGMVVEITGNADGNGTLTATYQGFTAVLPVSVGAAPEIIGIRVEPNPLDMIVGDTQQLTVFAQFSDGTEAAVTGALILSLNPMIAAVSATGLVRALSVGTGIIEVTYSSFAVQVVVNVMSSPPPQIISITPSAIEVGSPSTPIVVSGLNFSPGDTLVIAGFPVMAVVVDSMTITAVVPDFLLFFPGTLPVQVIGANGTSNTVDILVGNPPVIDSWAPSGMLAGTTVVVTVVGSGLNGLTVGSADLMASVLEEAADGSWVRISFTADAALASGPRMITLTNAFGSASFTIDVIAITGLMDLVVAANQTVTLSGTHAYHNVTVQTGGRIVGNGVETLAILASGDIEIRGSIDVSGSNGALGFTDPANGGNAGPGGAGGGGGGDGDSLSPAIGGTGSPPGTDAVPGFGSGTPAGWGGGEGGGGGAAFECGAGGGGGGLGGDGGSGGGDFGVGSGGFGGAGGGRGSSFGAGTGGGGGTTCGNNSGGGGGGGGGGLILQAAPGHSITVDGTIRANGGTGGDGFGGTGGGGGGSGGRIEIRVEGGTISVNDTISVRGGDGGNSDFGDTGGGAGGGQIELDATPAGTVTAALGFLDVTFGTTGSSLGGGTLGVDGTDGTFVVAP